MNTPEKLVFPAGFSSEIVRSERRQRRLSWGEGRLRSRESSESTNFALRILKDGHQGLMTSSASDSGSLTRNFSAAWDIAIATPADRDRGLAPALSSVPVSLPADGSILAGDPSETIQRLADLEMKILKRDSRIKKVVRLDWSESLTKTNLANSLGLDAESESSSVSFLVEVVAEAEGDLQAAWDVRTSRFAADIDAESSIEETAAHAVGALGGTSLPSGEYDVVLYPRVACEILDLMAGALSAEAVQRGSSFFQGQRGQRVAAVSINVMDDPLRPRGYASAALDDEGIPAQKINVIQDGVLQDYFYDLRTAHREGRTSNGHAVKASLNSPPRPDASNLFLEPGQATAAELLGAVEKIFYVWDVMGLHMADPITGEYSLGASGFLMQGGRRKRPVRGVTISGKIGDLLARIKGLANDLCWYGDRGSPHMWVSPVTVAGM